MIHNRHASEIGVCVLDKNEEAVQAHDEQVSDVVTYSYMQSWRVERNRSAALGMCRTSCKSVERCDQLRSKKMRAERALHLLERVIRLL